MKIRKQMLLILTLLFVAEISKGLSVEGGNDEITSFNVNTPIRVLLDREATAAHFDSPLGVIYVKRIGQGSWLRMPQSLSARIRFTDGDECVSIGDTLCARSLLLRGGPSPSDKLLVNTQLFRGAIKLTPVHQAIRVINIVGLEDYLLGTLGAEMSPSWEIEALKAQAVAARSYALYMTHHPKSKDYDMESGTQDQVYRGVAAETASVQRAVTGTRGDFLSFAGQPIKAYYHSRCGGMTELPRAVWSAAVASYERGVPCPYCRKFPHEWSAEIPNRNLLLALGFTGVPSDAKPELSAVRSATGRVRWLRVLFDGMMKRISSDRFRDLMGYTRIKSTNFHWSQKGDETQFEGVGMGHGVGMCQWGARYLAQQGRDFQYILNYYYPGAKLLLSQ